jgi:uncharacterized protein YegL
MANLIDITANTLAQNTFCFEDSSVDIEKIPVPIENAKFGILNFTAVTTSETKKELDFIFVVDCSGSMSDMCSDGRSKMQHIIHTLKNMITFLHEHADVNSNITIYAFDVQIYKIVERIKITDDNFSELLSKIDRINPKGSTNIEYALRKSAEYIQQIKNTYPDNIINHIFMTDGEATDGSKDIEILKTLVVDNVMNAFIGFGIEHDSSLLNGVGSVGKSSYHFIDKLESAGFIYGEILHSVIYKVLIDCEIQLTNGLIYDFKTNSWVQNLKIGDIISEANKIYNIISENPDEFSATIKGQMEHLIVLYPSTRLEDTDLSKHVFRQRTLQLMFEVNEYCNKKRELDMEFQMPSSIMTTMLLPQENPENNIIAQRDSIKRKLAAFMEEMKNYMTDNDLMEDKFMKNLCDDIYICYRTFDTRYGNMFCTARQTSQGTQRQYTVSNTIAVDREQTHNLYPQRLSRGRYFQQINRIQRQTNDVDNVDLDDIVLPILQHEVSGFDDTPYLTSQATQVMRFVSSNAGDEETGANLTQEF